MHLKRVISAAVVLPLFYILVRYFPPVAFLIIVLFAVLLGQLEFYRLHFSKGKRGLLLLGLFGSALICFHFFERGLFLDREVLTALVGAVLVYQLAVQKDLTAALTEAAVGLLGAHAERDESGWMKAYQFALSGPIYAGTNEIQRNVIAERVLGLPRT